MEQQKESPLEEKESPSPPPKEVKEWRTSSHLYAIKTLGEEVFRDNGLNLDKILSKLTPHWWHFYFRKVVEMENGKRAIFNHQMLIDLLTEWTKNPPPKEVLLSFKEDINFDREVGEIGNSSLRWKDILPVWEQAQSLEYVPTVSKLLYKFGSKFIFPVSMEQLECIMEKRLDLSDRYIGSYLAAIEINPWLKKLDWRDYYGDFNWIHYLIKDGEEKELIKVLEKWKEGVKVQPEVLEEVKEMMRDKNDWYRFHEDNCYHEMNIFDALLWTDDYGQITKNEKLLELVIIFGKFQLETDKRIDNYIRFGKMLERLRAGQRIARWADYWMYDKYIMKPMPTRINLSNTLGVLEAQEKWEQQ